MAAAAGPSVKLVVQRCDHAELLVDNASEWVSIDRGLVIFVSFCKVKEEVALIRLSA